MKKILLLIICSLLIATTACSNNNSKVENIENVKIKIKDTTVHSEKDINEVFDIIKYNFKTDDYKDCTLLTLEYTNKYREEEKINKKENDAEDAITITFKFKTGAHSPINFNPNSDYTYTAEFIKVGGIWKQINIGQG